MSRKRRRKTTETPGREAGAEATPAGAEHGAPRRLFLLLTAFFAGAAVMVIELAGNRVLAPWYGNSMYTWTGLIGVILVSISAGYYLGGFLADRRGDYRTLGHLVSASALLTLAIPVLQAVFIEPLAGLNLVVGPVAATAVLFAVPGCLLASVAPYSVRMVSLLSHDRHVGISAGSVGMAGTLGSVVGTFATGFVLVPHLPLRAIFLVTGGVLALLGLAAYVLFWPRVRSDPSLAVVLALPLVALGVAGALAGSERPAEVVHERNTFYHRIRVTETPYGFGDVRRTLLLDTTIEGGQLVVNPREIPADHAYQRYWELARLFVPHLERGAFLGGGAYAMPEAILDAFPRARLDVVEIDPAVVDVGREYFRVDQYAGRLRPVAADARRFLRTGGESYDLIFGDAYAGIKCIPPHLVTREFFQLVKSRLRDRGVFITNIASTPAGRNSVVFQSVAVTIGDVFAHQCVFGSDAGNLMAEQNLFLVAADHDLAMEKHLAARRDPGDPIGLILAGYIPPDRYDLSSGRVFTDSRNPVEYLVAKTLVRGNE